MVLQVALFVGFRAVIECLNAPEVVIGEFPHILDAKEAIRKFQRKYQGAGTGTIKLIIVQPDGAYHCECDVQSFERDGR